MIKKAIKALASTIAFSFVFSTSALAVCTGQFGGGTVCGNTGSTIGVPGPTSSPVLGISGTTPGSITFAGASSGQVQLVPQAAAGSTTLMLPNLNGTIPSTAVSPLVLNATTGVLSCPSCLSGAVFANPTAVVGLATVNGVATTAMRSDAAPPLDQSISPTMTGSWAFNQQIGIKSIATPSNPVSGYGEFYFDSGNGIFSFKTSAGTVSNTAVPFSASANNFLTGLGAGGVFTQAQPACTNLSDASAFCSGTDASGLTGTVNTARLPSPFTNGTASGSTSKFATVSGSLTPGNCIQSDASGNIVDAGAGCGGGGGSGTVSAGTANQIAFYGGAGTTVSGFGTTNNAVVVTNGSGVPSESTTLPSGLTIPSPALSGTVSGANTIPLSILAQSGANTMLGNWTGSTANVAANSMPSCPDTGGNHLNYVSGTGVTCGTTSIGTPASPSTSIQFNNSGSFGGSANLEWDGTGVTVGVSGTLGYVKFGNATSGTVTLEPVTGALGTVTVSLPAATDTLVGKATTDTFTNKTYDTAGTGNSFKINGTSITAVTGTGAVVLANTPTLITPVLGVATATSINKYTFTTPASSATLTIGSGKTFTVNNTITLAGTDSTTWTGASTNMTLAALDIEDQTLSGGATVTSKSLSTGDITVDCGARPIQTITNGGNYTITAPSADGYCLLKVTNNGSAGVTSFSGFSVGSNTGDSLDTTNGHKFIISVIRAGGDSTYSVKALQ